MEHNIFQLSGLNPRLVPMAHTTFYGPYMGSWNQCIDNLLHFSISTRVCIYGVLQTSYSTEDYSRLYIRELVKLHRIPLSIISNMGTQFTTQFWKLFQKCLGTQDKLSTNFHPQTYSQVKRIIYILEDMWRSCMIDFKGN